ncbi:FAD:protein FMN transferase [Bacteroidales bacterium OttesenSCG-928-K03]|nr:FAD:protein FMN transferase [Odoribacter sp. OttesenSCG-928-L07]MDL2239417.1 FAD:protein FMN transferase [Bacteroidales bacterium OttesenSCG-928-L14]MDL2240994.1 FAD:protein FMN transferase [Bacteroidales bacterium OttesenSCG-928-K22]MDL2242945.1 FAD:protein FMN transferase [Bacteroidales bacterium OttesenSCG-928-K03]
MKIFSKKYIKYFVILLFVLSVLPISAQRLISPKPFIIEGFTQGTYYRVTYYAFDSVVKKVEVEKFLADFLLTASLWEPNSIISQINDNKDVALNDNFIKIFNLAQKVSGMSDGAFDITAGNLINLWGFGNKKDEQPSQHAIDSLKNYVGYKNVELRNGKIYKKYPEISLNFNAIAKGYSVDLLSDLLKYKGLNSFLVDIGGEIRASGKKPDGKLWAIGIEEPAEDKNAERDVQNIVVFTDKSVATSGTYRRYYLKDGIRYSHTIDPKTGYPVAHTLLSVTVIADDCGTADAVATAFMVMGREKALEFLKIHPEFEAYFIYSGEDGSYKIQHTRGFEKYLVK